MTSIITLGRSLMAAGLLGLSATGFVFGDFVRKWEPVPAGLPAHDLFAWISNALLFLMGLGLLSSRTARPAALTLCIFLSLWILLLQIPAVAAAPAKTLFAYGGYLCGDWAVAMGALTLWVSLPVAGSSSSGHLGPCLGTGSRRLFALPLFLFGTSHLLFAPQLASLVPHWLPLPVAIVYLTGAAYIAAGVSILCGVLSTLAALLLAVMMSAFVALVDLVHVVATPGRQATLTGFCFETTLVGAAWVVAGSFKSRPARG
jgi:uncharacterized membrane protein